MFSWIPSFFSRWSFNFDLTSRRSPEVTYLLGARAMALGEQVTPMEFRSLHCPRAIDREDTPEYGNPTHWPRGVVFPEFSHSLSSRWSFNFNLSNDAMVSRTDNRVVRLKLKLHRLKPDGI